MSINDNLSADDIRRGLRTKTFGCELFILETVDSTNTYLKKLDPSALPEGTVVIADGQTAGRGRLGKSFASPAGEGIYMSLLIKPRAAHEKNLILTVYCAVAVCTALSRVCGLDASVKWVNDIFCAGKKICGILAETVIPADTDYYSEPMTPVYIGIGVNTGTISSDIEDIATSVYLLTGKRGFRNLLTAEILNELERMYLQMDDAAARRAVLDEYAKRLFILNKKIHIRETADAGFYRATVRSVGESGELVVETDGGEIKGIYTGEIIWD